MATVLVSLISSRTAAGVAKNLRKDLFDKIESFSNNEFDKFSTASLITRSTNDVSQVQTLLMMGIRMITYALPLWESAVSSWRCGNHPP